MKARFRSYLVALTIIMLAVAIGWVGRATWQRLRQLHRSLEFVQTVGFQLSERVESSTRILTETMLSIDLHPNPEGRAFLSRYGQELKQWIGGHMNSATSPQERGLMERLEVAVDRYLSESTAWFEQRTPPASEGRSKLLLEKVSDDAKRILNLCRELKVVEDLAQDQFVKDSSRALDWVQRLLLVSSVLLVSLTGALVLSLYRGTIAPPRRKGIQNRAITERDEKLAALGTMAAGMAHEIRNPLTAVNVRLHSLTRTLLPGSSEQEDALVIGRELQRLDRMLRQFLLFARPANPKLVTVSADYLLRKVHALLAPHLAKTAIVLEVESTPDSWIHADPDQIEQVLVNLVKNAAESIGRDGRIVLRTRNHPARLAGHPKPEAILEVSDTGTGVPPEVQPRLFDPFFTTKESGTGLGLSIAARIVEQHGGTIVCHSPANHGATFSIVLPLAEKHHDESSSDTTG